MPRAKSIRWAVWGDHRAPWGLPGASLLIFSSKMAILWSCWNSRRCPGEGIFCFSRASFALLGVGILVRFWVGHLCFREGEFNKMHCGVQFHKMVDWNYNKIFVGKLLTRSTRFTCFCTAQTSIFQKLFVKNFRIFWQNFAKIRYFWILFTDFCSDFDEILSEFRR